MLQDAKIQVLYFSLLLIEIFAETWYNVNKNFEKLLALCQKENKKWLKLLI